MDDDPKPPTQQATQPYWGSIGSIFWAPLGFAAVLVTRPGESGDWFC